MSYAYYLYTLYQTPNWYSIAHTSIKNKSTFVWLQPYVIGSNTPGINDPSKIYYYEKSGKAQK